MNRCDLPSYLRTLPTLLVLLLLSLAIAQPEPLPPGERFDQPVEFQTDAQGESLRTMIAALARGAGLTPVVEDVPDTPVIYDIGDPKPFRQVWELVLTLNGLDYRLLENDVVVVGPTSTLLALDGRDGRTDGLRRHEFYRVSNEPGELAAVVQAVAPNAQVEVLGQLQTLSVRATDEEHDQISAVLERYDTQVDPIPIELRTYHLSHASAEELAQVLSNASGSILGAVATASAAGDGDGEDSAGPAKEIPNFRVTAEPRTNSLIVAATSALQERLAQLIPELDAPQRQVNVQVRIQEISTRTARDLGINLSAGVGQFAANILSTGLNFVFDPRAALTALNVNAVLDTLETQGLSRRVDDTTVTVLNNGTGYVQAGGTIHITFITDGEETVREIPYGVQIEVSPRIAADGSVTLDVDARVEDVLSTVGDARYIELSTRAVTSTVTLQPGQSVLLSGLLQNQEIQERQSVPILGAIPLIGNLFGTTVTENSNTELLVIVNAHVLE
mgnify:CR=1 FL=1